MSATHLPSTMTHRRQDRPAGAPLSPPALVIGGGANALSIVRSLGRAGVTTYAINHGNSEVRYSRFTRWLPMPAGVAKEVWTKFLTGPDSNYLRGSVLLPASDDALEILIEHYDLLAEKFLLDLFVPAAQSTMLNKLATYQAARQVGVATPRFWVATSRSQIESLREELVYPLLIKPFVSHRFEARFGVKFLVVESYQQLCEAWSELDDDDLELMLVEKIPGDDSHLCSYYTYIDERGEHLFQFTKRIVRRFPPGMGIACRHVTDHIPALTEPSTALFRQVGLQGLANVEFKLDPRDGVLKLVECNARFTAANILLDRCGYDLANLVYQRVTGRPTRAFGSYRSGVYLWSPIDVFRAFLVLRRQGELTLGGWLRSILHWNVHFSHFQWNDPLPVAIGVFHRLYRVMKRSS